MSNKTRTYKYKGYTGVSVGVADNEYQSGLVAISDDVITFTGSNVRDAQSAFEDSVDDYLAWCKERGEQPEKPIGEDFRCPR